MLSQLDSAMKESIPAVRIETGELCNGIQAKFYFGNGWMLSVVKHDFSYGIEGAIFNPSGEIDYDNSVIPDGVEGHLSRERIIELAKAISEI